MTALRTTLGDEAWLRANEEEIKALFPAIWTHTHNLSLFKIGGQLKLLGIDWRTEEELKNVFIFLERTGFILRVGLSIKRNPNPVFPR